MMSSLSSEEMSAQRSDFGLRLSNSNMVRYAWESIHTGSFLLTGATT